MDDVFHNQQVLLYFAFYFAGKATKLKDCADQDSEDFLDDK